MALASMFASRGFCVVFAFCAASGMATASAAAPETTNSNFLDLINALLPRHNTQESGETRSSAHPGGNSPQLEFRIRVSECASLHNLEQFDNCARQQRAKVMEFAAPGPDI